MDHMMYMQEAIIEAEKAAQIEEVPIGAVVVHGGKIIGRGHNLRETTDNPIAHAEMIAIQSAAKQIGDWRLEGCFLYVTLEPCPMCAGAILQARVEQVIYGTTDPKAGCVGSLMNLLNDPRFNHQTQVLSGIRQAECAQLLQHFFRHLRNKKKQAKRSSYVVEKD